jgi:hypothetical protein
MTDCQFDQSHYRELLSLVVSRGFRTWRFNDFWRERPSGGRALLLRHDVDVSLELAREMAEIEAEFDVHSTYFVRVHASGYNPFSRPSYVALQRLHELGHEVGLHHEVGTFPAHGSASELLKREADYLTAAVGRRPTGTAMHIPGHSAHQVTDADLVAAGLTYEAGSPIFNDHMRFASDSNQRWKGQCACDLLRIEDRVYLAMHPVWWLGGVTDAEAIRSHLVAGK